MSTGSATQQRTAAETASAEFVAYLRELVGQPARAGRADDLISSLIAETDSDGARLTEDELITTCTLLLNAGHEATVNVVGNGVLRAGPAPGAVAAAAGRSGPGGRRRSRS